MTGRSRGAAELDRPTARAGKTAAKRDAIMRAAIEIMNEKSYALATMTEIAASLGLRDATLYHYFSSKQDLAYACHLHSLERFEAVMRVGEREASGADRLHGIVRGFLDDSARHGPLLYFGDHSYLSEDQRRAVRTTADRLTSDIEAVIAGGIADGTLLQCEPPLVARLLLGMIIWLAKWVPSVEGVSVDRLMAAIDAMTLGGLLRRA